MSDNLTPSQQAAVDEFATQLGTKPMKKNPGISGVYSDILGRLLSLELIATTGGLVLAVWGAISWALLGKIALTVAVITPLLTMALARIATAGGKKQ